MSLLELNNVSYTNDGQNILNNISIKIESHDYVSIVGSSGSGKSTFLKLCCHLVSPTSGTIYYKNKSLTEYNPTDLRKNIAYVFQTPYLFGDTVLDNINFPFSIRSIKPDQKRIDELFSLFDMTTEYLKKEVKNLSGGERQRIALIRSLIFMPDILLLDEITSALDIINSQIVENVISTLNKEGISILWVTHYPEQCKKYANKLLTIDAGAIKSLEVIA